MFVLIFQPYKTCTKYLRDVENKNETYLESEKYLINSEFLAVSDLKCFSERIFEHVD